MISHMEEYISKIKTCIGPSMYPTLKSGDGIQVEEYANFSDIKIGDVIICPHPNQSVNVVHRVIEIHRLGVVTRGDNNNKIDPYLIDFKDIKGKVVAAKRANKTIKITGGLMGYLIHKIMVLRCYFFHSAFIKLLCYLSRKLEKSGILNFIHPIFKTEIVYVKRYNVNEIILLANKKVAGKYRSDTSTWKIEFPYKYFINKNKLTIPKFEGAHK